MQTLRRAAVLALTLTVATSGCGDRDRSSSTTNGAVSTTASVPATSTTATSPPASAAPGAAPTSTEPPEQAELVLRADGVGPFDFGSDMSSVTAWLTQRRGPPTVVDVTEWPGRGFSFGAVVLSCGRQQILSWPSAGLTVGFSDLPGAGEGCGVETPGLRLWAWNLTAPGADGPRLRTEDGISVGDTMAELRSVVPATAFMAINDSTFFPAGFFMPGGEYGVLAWDWISDLQRALNANGAQLAVDGEVGPKTRAAVETYRISYGLDSVQAVLQALVAPPDEATVAWISSSGWFWEFECGILEPWGWGGC